MSRGASIVYIVDDDPRMCEALEELLDVTGHSFRSFRSIAEYLRHPRNDLPACLILDVQLPDVSGLDFQKQVEGDHPPIVFITGYGDIPSSVGAMKRGAVDFLTKPFGDTELLASVDAAIDRDRECRAARSALAELRSRWSALTPRESEVLPLVVSGMLNKQAAAALGISEVTLQIHRSNIMRKMAAGSLADLVRMAEKLRIPVNHAGRPKSG